MQRSKNNLEGTKPMKKLVYLVAGLAFFFVAALIGLVLYCSTALELSRNRDKTAAAREKRWAHKKSDSLNLEGKTEDEINQALDNLNKSNNENET